MNISPRSCRLAIAYAVATPDAVGDQRAGLARDGIGPCHGSQPAKMWFMMPVPRGFGQELRSEADQAAGRNAELQAHAAAAVVDHLGHRAAAHADLRR